jgi:hypothetical protein
MTICIATLCDNSNNIIGMSDTRITSWNSSFDSGFKVSYVFGTTTTIMVAGDLELQNTILTKLQEVIKSTKHDKTKITITNGKIFKTGKKDWTVEEITQLYVDVYNQIKCQRMENAVLKPYGLSLDTFMNGEAGTENFQKWLGDKVSDFQMPGIETIISGSDATGRHVFIVENLTDSQAVYICCDRQGFACIGNGAKQADSEFILAEYTPKKPFEEAIVLTYIAKKRAELARDVGNETTLCFCYDDETELFQSGLLTNGNISQMLEKSFKTLTQKEEKARQQVVKGFKDYVQNFIENSKNGSN